MIVFMIYDDNKFIFETINGNIESFGFLVMKYQNIMFNLAIKIVHNTNSAKDITQEAFIKAYNNLEHFDTKKSFFSWIYRITLNESLNYNKRAQFTESIEDDIIGNDISILKQIEENELSLKIQNAIDQLEDKYKSLIILKHYDHLSYEVIAQIMQLPIGKVKSRLYLAREKLKLSLGDLKNV